MSAPSLSSASGDLAAAPPRGSDAPAAKAPASGRPRTVAVIGNPNTGKSSLFNALSGSNAAVGNYAGVTVDFKRARLRHRGESIELIDLPGTYSLTARSLDEQVSVDAICGANPVLPPVDAILIVIDATALQRNLYLFTQLRESGLPLVLVANMWDRLDKSGQEIDLPLLRERLGVPVVAASAVRRQGIDEIKDALLELPRDREAGSDAADSGPVAWPAALEEQIASLREWFAERSLAASPFRLRRLLFDSATNRDPAVYDAVVGRANRDGLQAELARCRERLAAAGLLLPAGETKLRYAWIRETLAGDVVRRREARASWEGRIDWLLTHRWWGLAIFLVLMLAVFQLLYSDYTTGLLSGYIEETQVWLQDSVTGAVQPGPLRSLLSDGLIAGIGAVLVFVPQIAMLFLLLAVLEDCGYLARVAMLMDRLMRPLGLNGKAFLPLMTSFGCAVPGIMATRTIAQRSDRLLTMTIAPLMSCSARLPVYVLMTTAFVPDRDLLGGWVALRSVVLLAMMLLGVVVAVPVAWATRRFLLPGTTSAFVMEMPSYKWPSLRVAFVRVRDQVYEFVSRAGTLIFATAVIVWALLYFPGDRSSLYADMRALEAAGDDAAEVERLEESIRQRNAVLVRQSVLGRVGRAIEPVVQPLGWDWRIGVGVLASFPAREVIIATLGTIFALDGDVDETSEPLRDRLKAAHNADGQPLFSTAVALSVMVFFALCAQCAATLMIMRRESGSWRWPAFTFVYMTALAYVGALITYQVASRVIGA